MQEEGKREICGCIAAGFEISFVREKEGREMNRTAQRRRRTQVFFLPHNKVDFLSTVNPQSMDQWTQ